MDHSGYLIPLFDRRFVLTGSFNDFVFECGNETGYFADVYLIPKWIYNRISKSVKTIEPNQLYTIHFAYEQNDKELLWTADLKTNFVFIETEEEIILDQTDTSISYQFDHDIERRVGITEYVLYHFWQCDSVPSEVLPSPFPPHVLFRESLEGVSLCLLFTHYNSVFIKTYKIKDVLDHFSIRMPELSLDEEGIWKLNEWTIDKRFQIAKWSLKMEQERLSRYELYKTLILDLVNDRAIPAPKLYNYFGWK